MRLAVQCNSLSLSSQLLSIRCLPRYPGRPSLYSLYSDRILRELPSAGGCLSFQQTSARSRIQVAVTAVYAQRRSRCSHAKPL